MPATIAASAHLFLSKGRAKISLDYLSELLRLGADPFHDPLLEGLEGKESLVYASMASARLVVPAGPLRSMAPGLAKGLARLLLACPKPSIRLGQVEEAHYYSAQRKARWQIRLATRRQFVFRLGVQEFFVVTSLKVETRKEEILLGVLGRKKKRVLRAMEESGVRRQESGITHQEAAQPRLLAPDP